MSIIPAFTLAVGAAINRWRAWRAEVHTRRAIAALPHHLRKDIGWPDPLPDHRRRVPPGECLS